MFLTSCRTKKPAQTKPPTNSDIQNSIPDDTTDDFDDTDFEDDYLDLLIEVLHEKQFNAIATSYNSTAQRIAEHTATATRPQVMINTPYRDAWVLPSENNYMARIISDAGGRCYTTEGEGNTSKPIDIEQALLYAESADFWLNVGSCHTLQELTSQNPRFAKVGVVEDKKVYNNTARRTASGGSDFWESGVVRPDLILKDLATIFHPEIMGEEHTLYYYTRLN